MIASKVSLDDMTKALMNLNKMFRGNIMFNRLDRIGDNRFRFTLRCRSSREAGHRRGFSFDDRPAKRLISACWHVHGYFFEELFKINPEAVIYSSRSGKITIEGGNWQDRDIGSMMRPLMFSEACDCGSEDNGNITLVPVRKEEPCKCRNCLRVLA